MIRTAEAVSLGHPDKTADYISSYILDRLIEQDAKVRYAVEVMVKSNEVILAGEVSGNVSLNAINSYVKDALRKIGYDERYAAIWRDNALNINKIKVHNLISSQSAEISAGVDNGGWGDQGIFVGYACQGEGNLNQEIYLARKLNKALYEKARSSDNLGLDIKTQITMENDRVITAIAAIPMLEKEDLTNFICKILGQTPQQIIINGTGKYVMHSAVADCGITGRKLACDFYGAAAPIGGGSPWTKDATKADLTLNLYARHLAMQYLADYDEIWVYLSSCIGQCNFPSAILRWRKGNLYGEKNLHINLTPQEIISLLELQRPIYSDLCQGIS